MKSVLQENSAGKVSAGAVHLLLGAAFKLWLSSQIVLELHANCDAAMPFLAMSVADLGCTGDLQMCHGGLTWHQALWTCSGLWAGPSSPSFCWLY